MSTLFRKHFPFPNSVIHGFAHIITMLALFTSPQHIVIFINPRSSVLTHVVKVAPMQNRMRDYKEGLAECIFASVVLGGFGLHSLTVHSRECVLAKC